ncbi:flagellar hook-length control protein FliK [Paracoccus niistensis]|uniref:Flagellar hook-length control protein FliK n=1 Tax=Paracoccus niistensis TaxID=632935 RepID=A0ABV6I478_9RHOB
MPTAIARLSSAASALPAQTGTAPAEAASPGQAAAFEAVLDLLAAARSSGLRKEAPTAEPEAPDPDAAEEEHAAEKADPEGVGQPVWSEAPPTLAGTFLGQPPGDAPPAWQQGIDPARDTALMGAQAGALAATTPALREGSAASDPNLPGSQVPSPDQAPLQAERAGRPAFLAAEPPLRSMTQEASLRGAAPTATGASPAPALAEHRQGRQTVRVALQAPGTEIPELTGPAAAQETAAPPASLGHDRDAASSARPAETAAPSEGAAHEQAGASTASGEPAPLEAAAREDADLHAPQAAADAATSAPAMPGPAPVPEAASRPPARAEAAAPHPPHVPAPERPVADAIVRTRDGQVEVVLNPVELGRVTLLLGAEGDPGHLGLYVERPDTADLIRRHSDQLLRELRENGMPEARLDLLRQDGQGQNRGGGFRQPSQAGAPESAPEGARAGPADRPAPPAPSLSRLDIRL